MRHIDLNADLGEGGPSDGELMTIVSSCNIACGGHAGDASSMAATIALANEHDVAAGAHPSYPDPAGFGRRAKFLADEALRDALHDQVQQLATIADGAGVPLEHLKPHGALYHDANEDAELAAIVATVAGEFGLDLVGPADGALRDASSEAGIHYVAEGFVDRAYDGHGRLVARGLPGAVLERPEQAVQQALSLAQHQRVQALDGSEVPVPVETLCVHGDTPGALQLAAAVRSALQAQGMDVRAFRH